MSTKMPIRTRFASLKGEYEYVMSPGKQTSTTSVVRRTTFKDRDESRYYDRIPWIYYFKESQESMPILLNRQEAGKIANWNFDEKLPKWYLSEALDRQIKLVFSCNYSHLGYTVYNEIYKGATYKRRWFHEIPGSNSDIYFIVERKTFRGKVVSISEPIFITKGSANLATVYHQNIDYYIGNADKIES
ncbi:MAG: hypothetical protein IKN74_03030 [Clostridia bacterium]|nr:hypothetical protein [Clostridia bacterium]